MDINPEHTQGIRGKVILDENMEKVLSNRGTVSSTTASLPDIQESFAIGYGQNCLCSFEECCQPTDVVYKMIRTVLYDELNTEIQHN